MLQQNKLACLLIILHDTNLGVSYNGQLRMKSQILDLQTL
jgi:hypothetical protein